MAPVRFTVLHFSWGAEGDAYPGGAHEVAKPSKALLRAVGSAEAAGVLRVDEATAEQRDAMTSHIEPDDVSVQKLEEAQQDGRWQAGNLAQFVADRTDRLAYDDALPADHEDKLSGAVRAQYERELADAAKVSA